MKRVASLIASIMLLIALTGCTVPRDQYVDSVNKAASKTVFKPTGDIAGGCLGLYLVCLQPLYETVYAAAAATNSVHTCEDFMGIGRELGAVAYSTYGHSAFPLPENTSEVVNLCVEALDSKLTNWDGSSFYQGVVLYDDGKVDGWGKVYSLGRGNSVSADEVQLVISISKDLNRIGWIDYGTEKPTALTQEELTQEQLNGQN